MIQPEAHLSFLGIHVLPALGKLVGDILRLRTLTHVLGSLDTIALQEQEVWSQSPLGRVWVSGSALAFLGPASFGLGTRAGDTHARIVKVTGHVERKGSHVDGSRAAIDDTVGMLDVGLAQVGNVGLEGHQSHDDL